MYVGGWALIGGNLAQRGKGKMEGGTVRREKREGGGKVDLFLLPLPSFLLLLPSPHLPPSISSKYALVELPWRVLLALSSSEHGSVRKMSAEVR